MPRPVLDAPSDPGELTAAVAAALDGGPVVAGGPEATRAGQRAAAAGRLPGAAALLLRTSGSTGAPRTVCLGADALRAGARATHARLGGPGRWLLALPATHVAGLQVVVRSVVAGTTPVAAPSGARFTPGLLASLLDTMHSTDPTDARGYASLVPTQLHRVLEAAGGGDAEACRALSGLGTLDAVLLGGAAPPAPLLRRAREAGVRVVTTYGMTETCGGCVYDGVPLDGVEVRAGHGGVLEISGPVLADGYLEDAGSPSAGDGAGDGGARPGGFLTEPTTGRRWFRTSDLGTVRSGGGSGSTGAPALSTATSITILGRADDVLITGGVNVAPAAVEAALAGLDGVGEVCVVGAPHPEWGTEVVAVVTSPGAAGSRAVTDGANDDRANDDRANDDRANVGLLGRIRARVTDTLGAPSAPRRVVVVDELPQRGPGKVDRAACTRLARPEPGGATTPANSTGPAAGTTPADTRDESHA